MESETNQLQVDPSTQHSQLLPLGTIVATAVETRASGWLPCDGRDVPSEYPLSYHLSTTPNLSGRVLIGSGAYINGGETEDFTLHETGGEINHTLSKEELAPHSHPAGQPGHTPNAVFMLGNDLATSDPGPGGYSFIGKGGVFYEMNSAASTGDGGGVTGSAEAHNNLQPYYTVRFLIWAGVPRPRD